MPDALLKDLKRRMEGAVTAFHNEMKGVRTGRASASLVDTVTVEVYGSRMPINQLATVNVPEPRMISVQVWDQNNAASVEKAIASAGLGVNPMTEGNIVRVPVPDLTEDRRKELVKIAHQYAENSRISVRNIRRDGMDSFKKMQKDGDLSEDEQHIYFDDVQKLTDRFIKEIDDVLATKEKDIMEV